ncbi:MAG: 30S ribosomal protein S1 [Candidatus Eisenbacteria sp.]|nr:30S ribosomal protein S1 [Candidatus Eisenbacteria bacterium]
MTENERTQDQSEERHEEGLTTAPPQAAATSPEAAGESQAPVKTSAAGTLTQEGDAAASLGGDGATVSATVAPGDEEPKADVPRPPAPVRLVNREEPEEISDERVKEMIDMYVNSMQNLEEGEVLKGRVLMVDENDVLVDVGFKSEGVIALHEFGDAASIKVGEEIDVFLEKLEDRDGLVVLSKQRADFVKVWDRVKEAAERGEVVEGRLVKKIKGGVVVDLFGVDAFLPGSQIALRQPQSIESLMSETLKFKIIKLNKRRRNIVVSRRLVLEEEREVAKDQILKELEVGQIREGYVKNITDFGAFIDLGGIDGLLHITDMSWGRIRHPSEVVSVGDKVKIKLLSFDPERERISLGLKQLSEYPWARVDEKYPVGSKIQGRVVSLTEYGAFVELERGVEGLIHISEMSWTKHIRHPSKILREGQDVECMVLKVDKDNERISLGLKQVEPDPWLTLDEPYPVNSIVDGKVRNLTNFGAFVELEDGIDGLVHISDMSWTRRVGHPSEVVKKGDTVTVRVLTLDKSNRRVSLGFKQVQDDPWPMLIDKYPINNDVEVTVAKVIDRGAVVLLEKEVEGFIPAGQLGLEDLRNATAVFHEGDLLKVKITRVDPANHRILLSVKAWLAEQDEEVRAAFTEKLEAGAKAAVADEGKPGVEDEKAKAPADVAVEAEAGAEAPKADAVEAEAGAEAPKADAVEAEAGAEAPKADAVEAEAEKVEVAGDETTPDGSDESQQKPAQEDSPES